MSSFFNLFKKRKAPLACVMSMDQGHTHTQACFVDIMPLSVVELFQSQGCASCPPAVPRIQDATNNPNLLLLTYDVTYWNPSSGWEDTFGSTQWDSRQRQYLTQWGRKSLFTPQIVVDGVTDGIGATKDDIDQVVMKAMELRNGMTWALGIDRVGNDLRLAAEAPEADMVYDVLIVKYDPVLQTVKPRAGPNKSKKIPHRNVVKELMKIGEWSGGISRVALPNFKEDGFERVALVQGGVGGPIIAALKL
ncbi:uncharacterized protein Z520_09056 [Fonsecaea multimorphosa CBS 102226]|uniref:DUF1223-domain-containing protein n=1 Tax=Fonsecaea multimorphosa CBS 102226 TaxID=1442371 RepID=A0A0D2GZZ1_9EURO|nr:uncharacterized protein Z520_09056 [Fonsecaea multimorphosa CBS 102226]KIX95140.1 hypothetical protein Z520_09056 [Fonsecaea multimorphosa CBS 102226]OAL20861.1 hypothetical protein AYO22_08489 [Fonsecaea multimorphosa]